MRWLLGWRYISSLHSADEPQEGRNSCPLLRSYFIGSCHVGVSKRFSRSISLAVHCLSSKLEPAIWSSDAGQRIPCFNRCQLIIAWMSNIKEDPKKYMHGKPSLHVLVNLLFGVWPPSCAIPSPPPSCVRAHEQHR